MKRILITNDDGIDSPALYLLRERLSVSAEVFIVAPDRPMNAMSSSISLHRPVRIKDLGKNTFSVTGTPVDCSRIGIIRIMRDKADFLVSGINDGANLGDDVGYSGTVAAAREGTILGIPSLASSLVTGKERNFEQAADLTASVVMKMLGSPLPPRRFMNLNIPDVRTGALRGLRAARLGRRIYDRTVRQSFDPKGRPYYWLLGENIGGVPEEGTDLQAVAEGFASLTPLTMDIHDTVLLEEIKHWDSGS